MENVIWEYPNIKNLALERYDKEFVLDYAPRCYAESKDLESFFEMMDRYLNSQRERSQTKLLRLKLIDLLNLKIKLLEIENDKDHEMAKQNYERVSELRDVEQTLLKDMVDFTNKIDAIKNISNNREYQKLICKFRPC